jgi:prepilin signal peptidase PulO-like enzyme (type II secretory pathway)
MIIPAIFLFIIGTFFGSFLSVVNYRIHKNKKGILKGRSECPHCHKRLKFRDLIPIYSYLRTAGKCRICKKKIDINYLFIELATGGIFAAFYILHPFFTYEFRELACNFNSMVFFNYAFFVVVSLFLISIFFYDLKYLKIPEIFTLPTIALIFIVGLFIPEPGLYNMLIGGAIGGLFFGFQVWISNEKWLGKGDVQIGILMGLLLGWKLLIVSIFITYIIGSIISVILLSTKKLGLKSKIPFAPFMIIGTFITIFFGDYLLNLYLNTFM